MLLCLRAAETRGIVTSLAFGAAAALSISTRPTFLTVFLACAVWLLVAWRGRMGRRPPRRRRDCFARGFLVVCVPLAHLSTGSMQTSASCRPARHQFFIGNNPRADETPAYPPGALEMAGYAAARTRHHRRHLDAAALILRPDLDSTSAASP
jgi:4-amino-4-deoxy-L-arabinose transferase-like glycosyltransferase